MKDHVTLKSNGARSSALSSQQFITFYKIKNRKRTKNKQPWCA